MDHKTFQFFCIVALVVLFTCLFLTACSGTQPPGTSAPPTQSQPAQPTSKSGQASQMGCVAGRTETLVGRTYTILGLETYTIQGKSYGLCCWKVGEGNKLHKICTNSADIPVGYDYGILFETEPKTGSLYMSMETYQDGTKSCQQFYNVDGTKGPLNCQ